MQIHDYGEATKLYNEALEIDDRNVDVLMARTAAYLEMGDFIRALQDTEQMVAIEADNPEVQSNPCNRDYCTKSTSAAKPNDLN